MELDCTRCGACCIGLDVHLAASDEARFDAGELLALTRIDAEGRVRSMKQLEGGACIALRREGAGEIEGSPHAARPGRFTCAIYERRPDACREFESGARRCLQLREVRGLWTESHDSESYPSSPSPGDR